MSDWSGEPEARQHHRGDGSGSWGRDRLRAVALVVLTTLDAGVFAAGMSAAANSSPGPDPRFGSSLAQAVSQVIREPGALTCDIPGDLHPGRAFDCTGDDAVGRYVVHVTITDRDHDFHFLVSR
ncbi:MAG: hypothetical protein ACRD0H_18790 [Actinomycetes bacterium]